MFNSIITGIVTAIPLSTLVISLHMLRKKRKSRGFSLKKQICPHLFEEKEDLQKYILNKLNYELSRNRIHTNPNLTINDVANLIGTNRTYISSTINTFYNQNFCSYINRFRLDELKNYIAEDDSMSNQELAYRSGFGSIDTMKRALKLETGLTLKELKTTLHDEKLANEN